MANPLGRISGQLLKDDLTRTSDLEFDRVGAAEPLLHLNVGSRLVGVNTDSAGVPLEVNGTLTTTNIIVDQVSSSVKLGTQVRITGDILISNTDNLNLVASTHIVADNIRTSNLDFNNNVISSRTGNSPIEFSPSGDGTVDIHSNLNINNSRSLYASGDITLGGNITLGNSNTDNVIFNADVNSDINPNISGLYSLGSDPSVIGQKRWKEVHPLLINGAVISAATIGGGGINLAQRPGNSWFVAKEGNDTNVGDHENGAFLTIEHALTNVDLQPGDTILIYPGIYTEITPLTIPTGVALKGISLRSVTVVPDVTTQYNNIFLLNGQTTVDNITIADFYYDSILDTGYAFSFAPGFKVTSRSPYIQNVTVTTKGTVITADDPRGFASGDAGKGALVDGSVVDTSTNEATLLFNSVTFITPGVNALTMTNGVRIEWLNSFVYFANIGLYATTGVGRYDSNLAETRYGAEIRCMGSANVYGNYGAWAEGLDTLMYLVNHNFAYIGAGKDSLNDPSLNIAANETVEIDTGRIYYQSIDNEGNFHVGDSFKVSYETGDVSFNGLSVTAGGVSSIAFSTPGSETILNATLVSTGNIQFSGHKLTSLYGPVNLTAATNEIAVPHDVFAEKDINITGDFNIDGKLTLGNQTIDVVEFLADIEFDLRPVTTNTYVLGSTLKNWLGVNVRELDIGSTLKISGHTIETLIPGTDLELIANGAGIIQIPSNNVEIINDLTVDILTTLKTTNVTGTIDLVGIINRTGNITLQTGDIETIDLNVSSIAEFADIQIDNNVVTTISLNNDLVLRAASTGTIYVPSNNVQINQNLTVDDTIHAGSITVHGVTTATTFSDSDIHIHDNIITTTVDDHDLELGAAGIGLVKVDFDNTQFDQDLTVNDNTSLKNTVIGSGALASSLSFSSSNYLSLSAAQTIGTQAYTFECFFYTASNGLQTILGATSSGGMSIWLFGDGINPVTIIQIDRSNIDAAQYTVSPITLNTWHHLAVTRDSLNNASVFLDGVKAAGSTSNATNYTASSGLIGAVAGSAYFFTGYLTQIKLAVGSNYYDPTAASISVPTAVLTTSANTKLLLIVANNSAYLTDTSGTQTVSNIGGVAYASTGPSTSNITHVGNYLQTGSTLQTGNRSVSLTLDVDSNAYFDSISFVNNTIATTDADTDLSLKAAGSGQVNFNDNVTFSLAAEITTVVANGITNSGTITSDIFTDSNIEIYDNNITTTVTDSDLRLLASGIGIISLPLDPMLIDNDLTVSDSSILKNTSLTDLSHSGNTLLTGSVNQTGDLDISNNLTVTGTDAFFTDIRIVNNTVFTTATNSDLQLVAAGSGIIDINDNATFSQNLRVNGTAYTNGVTNSGTITSDIFTDTDIEINDNYITTTVGNNNLILLGVSTGGPKLEKIKFNTTTISTETTNEGLTLTVPSGSVSISASTALKVPSGTTLNRPTLAQGEFRFNSTDTLFRGYSTATVSFAGVYSANKLTNVLAHPTNNTLRFTTNSATNMTIGSGGLTVNSMSVDSNLTFATNIISTATTNADLYLTPNGIGEVVMEDISLYSNEFTNLNSTNALILQNTGSGYVKFSGTGGIAIPAGPTVIDTSGVEVGDLRYNTTLSITEVFNGVDYVGLSAASATLTGPEVEEITNLWALVLG